MSYRGSIIIVSVNKANCVACRRQIEVLLNQEMLLDNKVCRLRINLGDGWAFLIPSYLFSESKYQELSCYSNKLRMIQIYSEKLRTFPKRFILFQIQHKLLKC